jgi:hypothetical protein
MRLKMWTALGKSLWTVAQTDSMAIAGPLQDIFLNAE